jgi:phosphohistidine swiveling domain-containing protein
MKAKLIDYMHLNISLAFGELFSKCEGKKDVPWSRNSLPSYPACLAERRGPELHIWYDQVALDWKMAEASKFNEDTFSQEVFSRFQELKPILIEERSLAAKELREFIDEVIPFWVWFDGVWWAIEDADKNRRDTTGLMKMRKETEYFVPGLNAVLRNSFKKIAGASYEKYVDVLLVDEVIREKYPSIEVLEKRLKECAVVQGCVYDSLEEAIKQYDIELQRDEIVITDGTLRGQCAFAGKVKGKVKIVKSREDMVGFKQGNVIVSPTTTPDFIPVMKISSAIISEHGGVICHAAITSRELKIPCVVGVKGATRLLKDGDLVEVDAERGIIKILK